MSDHGSENLTLALPVEQQRPSEVMPLENNTNAPASSWHDLVAFRKSSWALVIYGKALVKKRPRHAILGLSTTATLAAMFYMTYRMVNAPDNDQDATGYSQNADSWFYWLAWGVFASSANNLIAASFAIISHRKKNKTKNTGWSRGVIGAWIVVAGLMVGVMSAATQSGRPYVTASFMLFLGISQTALWAAVLEYRKADTEGRPVVQQSGA